MSMINLPINDCDPIIKSDTEICPDCKNECRITNNEYNLTSICEFGHESNYTPLEFDQSQFRILKKISCNTCINWAYEDQSFFCLICKCNLCAYCKNHHYHDNIMFNSEYDIIEFNQKKYYCQRHMKLFSFYCFDCEKNLCPQCYPSHIEHKKATYNLDLVKVEKDLKTSNVLFNSFKQIFNDFIKKMISIYNKIEKTYNIYKEKNLNYGKRRTWQNLLNNKAFDINYFIQDFQNIINIAKKEKDDLKLFKSFIKLHNKISYPNSLTLIYGIDQNLVDDNKITKEIEIDILGKQFVKNNKEKFYLKYQNRKMELTGKIIINPHEIKNNVLTIQLCGFTNKITDLSHLLDGSKYFIASPDIHKINTKNVIDISYMFNACISLKCSPDISKLNLQNVKYLNNIFSNCTSLQKFINPKDLDLNLNKLKNAQSLYSNCPHFKNQKIDIEFFLKDKRFKGLNDNNENIIIEFDGDELYPIKEKIFDENFKNYLEYINESFNCPGNSIISFKDINLNEQDLNAKCNNYEELSSIDYESKSKKKDESDKNDSSIKGALSLLNNVLNARKANIIKLIQVNNNKEAKRNENSNVINKNNKKISKKFRRANIINYRINFSLDGINLYTVSNILKYLIYLKFLNHLRNKFVYIMNKNINLKYSTNESNFSICNLLYYSCLYVFSSIYGEKSDVYISFLNNNLLVFFSGKGGTMIVISYPYGYLLAKILYHIEFNSPII